MFFLAFVLLTKYLSVAPGWSSFFHVLGAFQLVGILHVVSNVIFSTSVGEWVAGRYTRQGRALGRLQPKRSVHATL